MNQLKIVFMGTATFSEAVLKNLITTSSKLFHNQIVVLEEKKNLKCLKLKLWP